MLRIAHSDRRRRDVRRAPAAALGAGRASTDRSPGADRDRRRAGARHRTTRAATYAPEVGRGAVPSTGRSPPSRSPGLIRAVDPRPGAATTVAAGAVKLFGAQIAARFRTREHAAEDTPAPRHRAAPSTTPGCTVACGTRRRSASPRFSPRDGRSWVPRIGPAAAGSSRRRTLRGVTTLPVIHAVTTDDDRRARMTFSPARWASCACWDPRGAMHLRASAVTSRRLHHPRVHTRGAAGRDGRMARRQRPGRRRPGQRRARDAAHIAVLGCRQRHRRRARRCAGDARRRLGVSVHAPEHARDEEPDSGHIMARGWDTSSKRRRTRVQPARGAHLLPRRRRRRHCARHCDRRRPSGRIRRAPRAGRDGRRRDSRRLARGRCRTRRRRAIFQPMTPSETQGPTADRERAAATAPDALPMSPPGAIGIA